MADIKVIGVLGSGQMGSGIAQLAAVAGISVVLVDSSDSALQKGMQGIRSSLQRFVKKGELTQVTSVPRFFYFAFHTAI
jgi:3-hydroxybutyryl-CoA dehydrogenase